MKQSVLQFHSIVEPNTNSIDTKCFPETDHGETNTTLFQRRILPHKLSCVPAQTSVGCDAGDGLVESKRSSQARNGAITNQKEERCFGPNADGQRLEISRTSTQNKLGKDTITGWQRLKPRRHLARLYIISTIDFETAGSAVVETIKVGSCIYDTFIRRSTLVSLKGQYFCRI